MATFIVFLSVLFGLLCMVCPIYFFTKEINKEPKLEQNQKQDKK